MDGEAEVGFVLRTTVNPSARLSEVDYVKVIIGWTALDAELSVGTTSSTTSSSTTTTTGPVSTTLPEGDG
jgi:hypothetical protein